MLTADVEHVEGSRLCHLRLRPDFQGYGFNLQAEKSKPGQFIGKVGWWLTLKMFLN